MMKTNFVTKLSQKLFTSSQIRTVRVPESIKQILHFVQKQQRKVNPSFMASVRGIFLSAESFILLFGQLEDFHSYGDVTINGEGLHKLFRRRILGILE